MRRISRTKLKPIEMSQKLQNVLIDSTYYD